MKLYYYEFYTCSQVYDSAVIPHTGFLLETPFEVIEYRAGYEMLTWTCLQSFKNEMKYRSPRISPDLDGPKGVAIVRIE